MQQADPAGRCLLAIVVIRVHRRRHRHRSGPVAALTVTS